MDGVMQTLESLFLMMVMYMFYASFSFTVITHYTGKSRLEVHFIRLRVVQKQLAATNKNVKFNCLLRP